MTWKSSHECDNYFLHNRRYFVHYAIHILRFLTQSGESRTQCAVVNANDVSIIGIRQQLNILIEDSTISNQLCISSNELKKSHDK